MLRAAAALVAIWLGLGQALAVQPLVGGSSGNLSTTVTQYVGFGVNSPLSGTADGLNYPVVAAAGVIDTLYFSLSAAPGAGTSRTATLRKNNADTALTCTISDAATSCTDASNSVTFAAGDILALKFTLSGAVAAANGYVGGKWTPTTSNENILYARTLSLNNAAVSYSVLSQNNVANWTTTQANAQQIIPAAGTVSHLYVSGDVATGAAKSATFAVDNNGTPQTLTCALAGAGSGAGITTCNDTTHSFSVSAGDLVDISETPAGTPTAIGTGLGVKFTPTAANTFVMLAAVNTADSAASTTYVQPNGVRSSSTVESVIQGVAPFTFYLTGIYVKTTDPGGSASRAFTLRVNGSNKALACTVTAGNTTCNGSNAGIAVAAGDLISIGNVPTSTPATGMPRVSLVGTTVGATVAGGGLLTLGVGN